MEPTVQKAKRTLFSRLFIDHNDQIQNTIFLAGTARSGSTWVANLINYQNNYRYLFEPFHSKKVEEWKPFAYRQYLRINAYRPQIKRAAKKILKGNIKNPWVDAHNQKFITDKRIIKEVRANLFLGWLKKRFPQLTLIILLRHPCAVAHSRLKLKFNTHIKQLQQQRLLQEDYLSQFQTIIDKARTRFEKHILLWCIEYYIALTQLKKHQVHLAFYEHFCTHPSEELDRLFSFLNTTYDKTIQDKLKEPSLLAKDHSAIHKDENLINAWRKNITETQIKKATNILNAFDLDMIYSKNSLPDRSNAYLFMKKHQA